MRPGHEYEPARPTRILGKCINDQRRARHRRLPACYRQWWRRVYADGPGADTSHLRWDTPVICGWAVRRTPQCAATESAGAHYH